MNDEFGPLANDEERRAEAFARVMLDEHHGEESFVVMDTVLCDLKMVARAFQNMGLRVERMREPRRLRVLTLPGRPLTGWSDDHHRSLS